MTTGRADLDEAIDRMTKTFGAGKELAHLAERLSDSEQVLHVVAAHSGGRRGALTLTTERLRFLWLGLMRSEEQSLPLTQITGVSFVKDLDDYVLQTEGASFATPLDQIDEQDGTRLVESLRAHASFE